MHELELGIGNYDCRIPIQPIDLINFLAGITCFCDNKIDLLLHKECVTAIAKLANQSNDTYIDYVHNNFQKTIKQTKATDFIKLDYSKKD